MVEKLQMEQMKMKMKFGNKSCILQEVGMIDSNMNLDLGKMLKTFEEYNIKDQWLHQKGQKVHRLCYAVNIMNYISRGQHKRHCNFPPGCGVFTTRSFERMLG